MKLHTEQEFKRSVQAQAKLRLALGLPITFFILVAIHYWGSLTERGDQVLALGIGALYCAYNVGTLLVSHRPGRLSLHHLSLATAVLDPLWLSMAIALLGEISQIFICLYLFTILGFGLRIGIFPMWVSAIAALAGYSIAVFSLHDWQQLPLTILSNIILLSMVPLYATSLIKKLHDARTRAIYENQAKSRLLANVSHELRTPLTGIVSSAQLIKDEIQEGPQKQRRGKPGTPACLRHANTILQLSANLMTEIDDLLDSAKYEGDRLKIGRTRFDLRDVMTRVRITLAPTAAAKHISISVSIDERIECMVEGDPHYLARVMLNIGANAVKFTDQGGVAISLNLLEEDGNTYTVRFSCQDTGIGIPQQLQRKIFEPFYQVSNEPAGDVTGAGSANARKYGGTGLGMSIAHDIVAMMGGEMRVQSEPGKGSIFSFDLKLPKSAGAVLGGAPNAKALPIVQGKKILIADDHRTNLMLLKEMLERDRHLVKVAESGEQAIRLLGGEPFDIVFLDYNMGDIDGATVLGVYFFCKNQPAPVYLFTADTTASTANRLKECGAFDVLHKPVSAHALRCAIARAFVNQTAPATALTGAGARSGARRMAAGAAGSGAASGNAPRFIDPEAISDLHGINHEKNFLIEVLTHAIDDIERIGPDLLDAIEHRHGSRIREQAHALHGIALSIGAAQLSFATENLKDEALLQALYDPALAASEVAKAISGSVCALRGILSSLDD